MILVRTEVKPSPISGLGLFAKERIKKGTIIWKFIPGLDVEMDNIGASNENIANFLNTYCFRNNGKYILCVDNGKYINHSDNPNTDDTNYLLTIASRDIDVGEEITSNYLDFGPTEEDKNFNKL